MELSPFEAAGALLAGMLPPELGEVKQTSHKYGIKVWFDTDKAPREHYEAQVLGKKDVPTAKVIAIEVGFHAEHSKEAENEAVVARLRTTEKKWRKNIGKEAEVDAFL